MITLIIKPNFKFKLKEKECGEYSVILPQNNITIWTMSCSSLQWAITDAELYFNEILEDLLDNKAYQFIFDRKNNINIQEINKSNEQIDITKYLNKRKKYILPPWKNKD